MRTLTAERGEPTDNSRWVDSTYALLRGRDLIYLIHLPILACIAWFVPERAWDAICRALVPLARRLGLGRQAKGIDMIAKLLEGGEERPDARTFVPVLSANLHRARLHVLRCYRSPEWRPELELIGREHLEGALAEGRGAILWVAPLVFSDLFTKMAIHRAGIKVAHLSRCGHGFSPTRFGVRFLNPIWTRIEDRYLGQRLMMLPDNSSRALRSLIERVRQNEVISVTVGGQGTRAFAVPFLNGLFMLADGAPALALRTGAALLPVFTVRKSDGRFVTTIEPELRTSAGDAAAVRQLVMQEAALLESWVLRFPSQFVVWESVRQRPDSEPQGKVE